MPKLHLTPPSVREALRIQQLRAQAARAEARARQAADRRQQLLDQIAQREATLQRRLLDRARRDVVRALPIGGVALTCSFPFFPLGALRLFLRAVRRPLAQEFPTRFCAGGQGLGCAELFFRSEQLGAGSIGRFHARNRPSGAFVRHCLNEPGFMQ